MSHHDDDRAKAALALWAALGWEAPPARADEALTHRSFRNEVFRRASPKKRVDMPDNQRLEFLGDAVLGLCVSELLMEAFPQADEGALSRMRAALVNADALAEFARSVGVGPALRLGKGAGAGAERDLTNVLADAVEALTAAAYLDGGFPRARSLALRITGDLSQRADLAELDPKSELQERIQSTGKKAPSYTLLSSGGSNLERWFEVEVRLDGAPFAAGKGRSRKIAEQAAARAALEKLRSQTVTAESDPL